MGFAYLGMSQAETLLVACLMSVVGGAGNGIQWVAVMTALQEATPTDYQARMSGLLESIGAAMPGVGFLLGGLIVTLGSPRTAFAVAGGGILLLVLAPRCSAPGTSADQTSTTTGKHHGTPLEPLVDERREVVVQEGLQHVDLGDLLLGGAVQRVLDRLAQLADERVVALQERHAAREHLGRDDRRAVLLGDRGDDDEDAVGAQHAAVAQRDVASHRRCPRRRRRSCPAVSVFPRRAPSASISSGVPFSVRKMFAAGTPTACASSEWISIRLKSPCTGITYFGRVRLIIILTSSA